MVETRADHFGPEPRPREGAEGTDATGRDKPSERAAGFFPDEERVSGPLVASETGDGRGRPFRDRRRLEKRRRAR